MASMATAAADAGRPGDRFAAVVEEVASKGLTATQLRYYELMRAPDFMYEHLSTAQAREPAHRTVRSHTAPARHRRLASAGAGEWGEQASCAARTERFPRRRGGARGRRACV